MAIVIGIWITVITMLALSVMDEGQALLPRRSQVSVNSVPYIIAVLAGAIVILIGRKAQRNLEEAYLRPRVLRAALAAICAAVVSGLITGIASSFSAGWWYRPPPYAVDIIVVISMLVPLAGLLASATAAMAAVSPGLPAHDRHPWRDFLLLLDIRSCPARPSDAETTVRAGPAMPDG